MEVRKKKLADELKVGNMESKFSAHYDAVEVELKSSTVGLLTIEQMKERQEEAIKEREKQLARKSREAMKTQKKEEEEKQKKKEKQKQQVILQIKIKLFIFLRLLFFAEDQNTFLQPRR